MTVYIDNVYIPATVGRYTSKWCHLMSDQENPEELHAFAKSIGLKKEWFQRGNRWWHNHYDVTENKRKEAVTKGAIEINFRDWVNIAMKAREK